MTMSEQPPFRDRPDLPELLQSERERPEPPREAKLRVLEAMRRSIADAEGEERSQSLRLVPKAAGSLMGWLFAYAPLALAGLGATGFFALGAYLAVHPDALQPLAGPWRKPPEVRVPVSVPLAPAPPAATPQAPPKHTAVGVRALPVSPPADPGDTSHAQSIESRLLEQARKALKGGRNEAALRSLAEAEKVEEVLEQGTYAGAGAPDGALTEEREALMVLALSRSGNAGEAKRQMARFTARHPQSFYLIQLQQELKSNEAEAR
jgi:hypothetical protein